MKLGRRILDLVRAVALAPRRGTPDSRPVAPDSRPEGQLEQIRCSLARADVRRQKLQDDLAAAEEAGRNREAVRLRRQMEQLSRSAEQLQGALDRIDTHLEAALPARKRETRTPEAASSLNAQAAPTPSDQTSAMPQDANIEARKRRLSRSD